MHHINFFTSNRNFEILLKNFGHFYFCEFGNYYRVLRYNLNLWLMELFNSSDNRG